MSRRASPLGPRAAPTWPAPGSSPTPSAGARWAGDSTTAPPAPGRRALTAAGPGLRSGHPGPSPVPDRDRRRHQMTTDDPPGARPSSTRPRTWPRGAGASLVCAESTSEPISPCWPDEPGIKAPGARRVHRRPARCQVEDPSPGSVTWPSSAGSRQTAGRALVAGHRCGGRRVIARCSNFLQCRHRRAVTTSTRPTVPPSPASRSATQTDMTISFTLRDLRARPRR
jgi:hypothetical protein